MKHFSVALALTVFTASIGYAFPSSGSCMTVQAYTNITEKAEIDQLYSGAKMETVATISASEALVVYSTATNSVGENKEFYLLSGGKLSHVYSDTTASGESDLATLAVVGASNSTFRFKKAVKKSADFSDLNNYEVTVRINRNVADKNLIPVTQSICNTFKK